MKKLFLLCFTALAAVILLLALSSGCKNSPSGPAMTPGTATTTPTITPTATESEVVSPTVSATTTATSQAYVVDDFESGTDNWTVFKDAGSLSNVHTGIVGSSNPALFGAYALGVTGEAWAETGSAPYAGFSGIEKTFGPVDVSSYAALNFAVGEKITFIPYYGGPVTYTIQLKSGPNIIESSTSSLPSVMTNQASPLSGFTLPAGATGYTAASVLASVDAVVFMVSISSSVLNDWIGYEIYFDNIEFSK